MFATVECRDAPAGFKGFVRDIFTLPEITLQQIKIPSGNWFYRVISTEYRGCIPVEETAEKLKRLKKSVIFEVNFPCDENTRELEFEPSEFTAQLIFNSALEYIKKLKSEPLESSVTVYDPEGFYSGKISTLVPLFSKITVHTKKTHMYEGVSEKLMDEYGLMLVVSDSFSGKAPVTTAAICYGEVPFSNFFNGILFATDENVPPCACCVRGYGIDLPGEYELLRPNGISQLHFAAALYEKGGVKKLGDLSFKKLRLT